MLTNIIYTGHLEYPDWNISLRQAKHPALITMQTFHKIQERMGLKAKALYRKDLNEDFPLRGFILCASCNDPATASWSKGRNKKYPNYHCKNPDCDMHGKSLRRDNVHEAVENTLKAMTPSKPVIELTELILKEAHASKKSEFNKKLSNLDLDKKLLDQKIDGFMGRLLETDDKEIVRLYENHIKALEQKRQILSSQAAQMFETNTSYEDAVGTVFNFIRNPHGIWVNGDIEDKRLVMKLAFAKRIPYCRNEGLGTAEMTLPFSVLADISNGKYKMVEGAGFEPAYAYAGGVTIRCL